MAELFIGTSGWNYRHWRGLFYPDSVPAAKWLEYYSTQFRSAEVNYSFYRLPKASTYEKWLTQVPDDFIFSLKCSRLISHAKRLGNVGDLWENFSESALTLGRQLGPILFQLPENFQADTGRLDEFLAVASMQVAHRIELRLACEFRHESWFKAQTYRILEKHNCALVTASSAHYPLVQRVTADFAYFRYHGPEEKFASSYSKQQLKKDAGLIEKLLSHGTDVYAYFNNDGYGYAVRNAQTLQELTERKTHKAS